MNYFRCGGGRSTHTATKIDVAKTPLASFESNVSGLYIPEILAYFSATQSGTGDPSPSNPRPISGFSSVVVTNNDGETPPETEETVTVNLGGTYYGGYLNVTTGLLTVTHGYVDLSGLSYSTTSWGAYRTSAPSDCKLQASTINPGAMAEKYKVTTYSNLNNNKPNNNMAIGSGSSPYFYFIADSTPTGLVMYERKDTDYETIQLTPAQIEQLLGQNNVFCSSGDVAVKYWKID